MNLSACKVGIHRAKSVPAAAALAGDGTKGMCGTILVRHGERIETGLPEGVPISPEIINAVEEKMERQKAVMRYGEDFTSPLSKHERVLVEVSSVGRG